MENSLLPLFLPILRGITRLAQPLCMVWLILAFTPEAFDVDDFFCNDDFLHSFFSIMEFVMGIEDLLYLVAVRTHIFPSVLHCH